MTLKIVLGTAIFSWILYCSSCDTDVHELKCLVCTRVIEEMQKNISKVDAKKTINVGGFRLDDKGNYLEKSVVYSRSEIYLTELMENICTKMEDYVRATFKENGKVTVIPLVEEDGKMNPIMSAVDVVQDSDLNKSLKYYCEIILDDHDETFMEAFSKEADDLADDLITSVCRNSLNLCSEEIIKTSRITPDEL